MARRCIEWEKGLARDLRDPNFVRSFIQAGLGEGLSLQLVLGKVIRSYGVKEYAAKAQLPSSNVLRAINPKSNPTIETLGRLLEPFGLELSVALKNKKRVA
jgi:DNA-binding phage protein